MKLPQFASLLLLIALLSCRTPAQKASDTFSTSSKITDQAELPLTSENLKKPPTTFLNELPNDGLPVIIDPEPAELLAHDSNSFTQGLIYSKGFLYESTGRSGSSCLNKIDPATGKVEESKKLSPTLFGEGLSMLDDKIYQLTWQNGVCLIYSEKDLATLGQLFYSFEGWGLTTNLAEKLLVLSDGSQILRFLSPSNFITKREVTVKDGLGQPVYALNELEWIKGEVWANVWMTDRIARIDPKTGSITGWVRFPKLTAKNHSGPEDVLNGIAYDPKSDTLWITGKLWKNIYTFKQMSKTFF